MKKFLVLFLLICSMVSAQPATPKYGQNIPPGGVLGFYSGDGKFYVLPVNASGALLVDSGEVPLWELNASGVVETLNDRAIDALSLQLSSDGTAAAPSISFGSDPDTGIYRYGAGSIGFSANGAYAGRWSAAGNFLIATSTDDLANKLQVDGSAGVTGYLYTGKSGNGGVVMYQPSSSNASAIKTLAGGNMQMFSASGDIDIYNNLINAVGIRIKANTGALLINTTTDDGVNKLQVNGNIKTKRLYYDPASIPVFADDAAAKAGGYNVPGATYRTSTGALMMVLP